MHVTHVPSSRSVERESCGSTKLVSVWCASPCSGESARGLSERSVLSAEVESFSTYPSGKITKVTELEMKHY